MNVILVLKYTRQSYDMNENENENNLMDYINQQNTSICHIRRGPVGWVPARLHHLLAFESFLGELVQLNGNAANAEEIRIITPHTDGGMFVAHFRCVNDEVCIYRDEYGNQVDIAMLSPSRAGFINRLMAPPG